MRVRLVLAPLLAMPPVVQAQNRSVASSAGFDRLTSHLDGVRCQWAESLRRYLGGMPSTMSSGDTDAPTPAQRPRRNRC